MSFGHLTYPEISSQPEALKAAWEQLSGQMDWVRRYLAADHFDETIFIGSGSSYYQALTMASTHRAWTGRRSTALPSAELYLFRKQNAAAGQRILVIGVSRSGESTEVVLALDSVRELPGYITAGITCYENSTMAQKNHCLVSPLGKEKSTVMTKSFSSMTFMMQAAIASATGNEMSIKELEQVMGKDNEVVQAADGFMKALVQSGNFNKYIYLGMGAFFGLAQEAMLKVKEMSYVWTESYRTLEFRHGPKSIVDEGSFICLLVSEQARSYELKVAEEMKGYGAHVLLITAKAGEDTQFADTAFETGGEEWSDEARSVLYMPPLQYFGYYTALKRQVDPDHPRNLTQVVKI